MMSTEKLIPEPLSTIIDEAVSRYDEVDPANALAFVVEETTESERETVLQAVADEVIVPETRSRSEQRELFLLDREKAKQAQARRLGHRAARRLVSRHF